MSGASSSTPQGQGRAARAREALNRIGALYAIEAEIGGRPPGERQRTRQARAGPLLAELKTSLETMRPKLSGKSDLASAMRYALSRWTALTRYCVFGVLFRSRRPSLLYNLWVRL